MEKSINNCPQCGEPYSSSLPKTQHYSRCSLPLTLHCGHGVCYHCIVSKRLNLKYGVSNKGPDSTTIRCAVCRCVSVISHEAVRNVLTVINCYQLGLVQLNDLKIDMAGENVQFKDGTGGLFVPSNEEIVVNRSQQLAPPGKCPIHDTSMEFWCYNDEILLCEGCRIYCHLGHDVVKIVDRNKEELASFYEAADEAVELVSEMKKTCLNIKKQSERLKWEYDVLIKQMRIHFVDLHSLLAAREQQVQHELFQKLQERSGSLNSVERYIREGYLDMSIRLMKATEAISSDIPPSRSAISRLTESIRQSNSYKSLVDETRGNLKCVTLSTAFEPKQEYVCHLRHDPVATIHSEYEGASYWNRLLSQFDDFKQEKARQSLYHFHSTSPCEPSEKKRARKHTHVCSSPLVVNHYESGAQLTGRIVHVDAERFYIQVQNSPGVRKELEELQTRIQICEMKPAPRLNELHPGQVVACLFHGFWYRALIEDINFKVDDMVIFFVDYGNRKLTTVESIRLLNDEMLDLPAQAVPCALSDSKTSISCSESKFINVKVDRVEAGGVGRLDGQEYTLWVTLCPSANQSISGQISPPKELVDSFTAYPPSRLHKAVRTIPTPPPPEAVVPKKKRFPAKDWVPRTLNSEPTDHSSGHHHHRHPAAITASSIQSSKKTAFKALPMPSQSPVFIPPPQALDQGQENRFRTKVVVTHLNSPGNFYVRIDAAQKMYDNLTRQLTFHFANSSLLLEQLKQAEVKTVGLVCATNADGQWNRCLIMDVNDDQTVTVRLTDVGKQIKANGNQLFRLDQSKWKTKPELALECRLWGVRPAGHATKWSGSSTDKMMKAIKKCSALFIQVYYVQEEEIGDTGIFHPVHYVRFYHEYIKAGGPLEFDQTLTGCLNDELIDDDPKLAFRDPMLVTVQPTPKRWLPSVTLPPELERAILVWMDDDGLIYCHRPSGPTNHVATINKLIKWHYEKSTPTAADLAHWIKDEPCIVLYTDRQWCRAIVLSADDEAQLAFVFFVDYGNSEQVPYQNMRKALLCYEYPIQATRCRLSRYPGPEIKPTGSELEMLHELLLEKEITLRVIDPAFNGSDPVVDIWFSDVGVKNLKEIFGLLRPGYKYSSTQTKDSGSPVGQSSPLVLATPPPTVPLSSIDLDDSIFHANASEFSDDVYPIFTFDVIHELKETDVYRPLFIPRRVSLPIRVISVDFEKCQGVFCPQRYSFKDSPREWQEQIENYASLHTELQRAAPLFPDVGVVESGSPCACHDEYEGGWHRGKVLGYTDDDLRCVRVELVDLGINIKLPICKVKQLPTEYLSLPRHSTKAKMMDYAAPSLHRPDLDFVRSLVKKKDKNRFVAFFREVNEPLHMTLLYKTFEGKVIRAIE